MWAWRLQFRVVDMSTGQPREMQLTDYRQIENKLQSQRADMEKVNTHIGSLRQAVSQTSPWRGPPKPTLSQPLLHGEDYDSTWLLFRSHDADSGSGGVGAMTGPRPPEPGAGGQGPARELP